MKYIVEVGEPLPSNLDEVAGKVAASFNISDAKAMALLRRAPGAMTKAVSEREADVVAGIFERAGLNVVKRPAAEPGAPAGAAAEQGAPAGGPPDRGAAGEGGWGRSGPDEPTAAPSAGAPDAAGVPEQAPPPVEGAEDATYGGTGDGFGSDEVQPVHPPRRGADEVWDQPLGSTEHEPVDGFSRRDAFEQEAADIGWEGGAWNGSAEGAEGREAAAETGAPTFPQEPELDQAPGAGGGLPEEDEDIDVEVGTPPEERPAGQGGLRDAMEGAAAAGAAGAAAAAPDGAAAEGEARPAGRQRRRGGRRGGRREQEAVEKPERAPRGRAAGRSAERGADEARPGRGGVSRGIAWAGVLPPLLSLLAMGVAMLVTLVPVARDQQAAQAADAAAAQAAALQALTGGLPLTAQTLSGALTDLSNNAQALLQPNGVSLMVVTDANGAPLAGWYGPAKTPAAMPPATRQAVSARALAAVSGQPPAPAPSFTESVRNTWHTVEAMVGQGGEATVLRAAPVVSAGQALGSVVVGVPPVSAHGTLVTAFETVLLVGLIPLLIGILMAMGVTGGMRRKVRYLLQAADRISRGELDEPVTLRGRDAFGQLGRAIERMRVSLVTLLEHRRRHR